MDYKYTGLIIGMEELGCKHIKTDFIDKLIYFDVPQNYTNEMLKRSTKAFKEILGLTLKFRKN